MRIDALESRMSFEHQTAERYRSLVENESNGLSLADRFIYQKTVFRNRDSDPVRLNLPSAQRVADLSG
jgi:hypothetical protein